MATLALIPLAVIQIDAPGVDVADHSKGCERNVVLDAGHGAFVRALLAGTGKPLGGDGKRVVEVRVNGDLTELQYRPIKRMC